MGIKMSKMKKSAVERTGIDRREALRIGGGALAGLAFGGSLLFSGRGLANGVRPSTNLYQRLTKWAKETRKYILGKDTDSPNRFSTSLKIPFGNYDITVVGSVYKNEKDKSGVAFRILRISDKATHMDVVKLDKLSEEQKRDLQSLRLIAEVNDNYVRVWAVVNGRIEKSSTVLQTFKFDGKQVTTYGKPIYLASAK
jgi:hypothetical protein